MRKALRTFFYSFKNSLINPSYYHDILKTGFSFSLKYLLMLFYFVFLIKIIFFSINTASFYPKLPEYMKSLKNIIATVYPKELVVTMHDGQIRTNVDEPYYIPFPSTIRYKDWHLAVIDTKNNISDPQKYRALFLVSKNAITYPEGSSDLEYKTYYFTDMKGYGIFNREAYDRIAAKIIPLIDYIPSLFIGILICSILFLPFLASMFSVSGALIFLLFWSLPLFIIGLILKVQLTYKQIFRLSMHGLTFSILLESLKELLALSIPYTFTTPYVIWMIIVFYYYRKQHAADIPTSQSIR